MRRSILVVVMVGVILLANIASADTFGTGSNQFTIDFVNITENASSANGTNISQYLPGHPDYKTFTDPGGYRMGTYEITNDQWNKFTNIYGYTIGSPYYRTEVGAHENSDSPYGTFDMGGNVWEWNEALIGGDRGLRGGSYYFFAGTVGTLRSSYRHDSNPSDEDPDIGFRVASSVQAEAVTIFDSNATISSGDTYDTVVVKGDGTVVDMTGGTVTKLYMTDASTFNISGGNVTDEALCYDKGELNMSANASIWLARAYGRSMANFSGGSVNYVDSYECSTVNISGGIITEGIHTRHSSAANIVGGSIPSVTLDGSGTANIRGGTIGRLRIADIMNAQGKVNILGYNLSAVPYGGSYGHGQVTGSWHDDTNFNINFEDRPIYSFIKLYDGPVHTLTMQTNPAFVDAVNPSVGSHDYAGCVNISAENFVNCPDIYRFDHWEGDVADANSANTIVTMDTDKTVTAVFVLADPRCGDECHPNFLLGDHNHDCIVNFSDMAMLASRWLDCTRPECD